MSSNALQPTDYPNQAASLHDAMGRLLGPSFFAPFEALMSRGGPVLAVDIDESNTAYTLRASLPGVKPENVQIEVSGSTVVIKGEIEEEVRRIKQTNLGNRTRWSCMSATMGRFSG